MPEGNNSENQKLANQKCPFCHNELIIKNDLLFCPKCALFIGDPKTFTGSLTAPDKIENDAIEREEETTSKKKGRAIWQVAIIILMIGAVFSIYQFKLWTFVIGIDYSSVKEIQKEAPFTIYLPKKIPLGYNLEKDKTNINYNKSGKINSIDFTYKKIGVGVIEVSIFPIRSGFTPDNKTTGELFTNVSSGKDLSKTSIDGQDIYTSESDLVLTDNSTSVYNIVAITTYNDLMVRIEYAGSTWMSKSEIQFIASSLRPVNSL
ncbi:MAG: hypothetical protein NUV64_03565 [Parcubacteria group bacterium]|nr:hypothetical protein [Parcubacteria group bacterium]MCR4342335.1 hypothetical protein [Patescibacteria group bacterium]